MTDKELKEIYKTACFGKGFQPNDSQFKLWKQTLGWAEEADLAKALVYYFQESSTFPMPAELKHLIERSRRERLEKSTGPCEQVEYECPQCHAPFSTVVNVGDTRPRLCLVVAEHNELRGCRVRLTELNRMPVNKQQKRA